MEKIADKWRTGLKKSGYEHHVSNRQECQRLRRFSRVWRRIFGQIKLNPFFRRDLNIFEAGCGGGKHLMMFALNNWKCTGLDCSKEVLERAKIYIQEASGICKKKIDIGLICDDFLNYAPSDGQKFDIVFQVGVLEHFLDESKRLFFLEKMFNLAKPGGYIILIVPSGVHLLREKMKKLKLGGYDIPEIDYNPFLMKKEFEQYNGREIKILPHNLFGYLLIGRDGKIMKLTKRILYYISQGIPSFFVPESFALRYSTTLIGIARKIS